MTEETPTTAPLQLQLDLSTSQTVQGRYATNYALQILEHEIVLSFFEAKPSIVLDPAAAVSDGLDTTLMPTECVARILMSPLRVQQMAMDLMRLVAHLANLNPFMGAALQHQLSMLAPHDEGGDPVVRPETSE